MEQEELKLLRLRGQRLLEPATAHTVVRDLCGLQAQFLSHAIHGLRLRSGSKELDGLVKSWTLRGTMHMFTQEDLPLFLYEGRKRTLRPQDTMESDNRIGKERKRYFADLIISSVESGIETREALKAACMAAGMTEMEGESLFDPWGGVIRALCEAGFLCHKVQEKKAYMLCPPFEPMEREQAELELAGRYFASYGPASLKDAAYFFGTTQKQVKYCLSRLPAETTTCEGNTLFFVPKEKPVSVGIPKCMFLAGFDPLMLGYDKRENPFLPQRYIRNVFSSAGIVMPAVLLHGRVVGKWKSKGKTIEVTLFEAVSQRDLEHIRQYAEIFWPDKHFGCMG